VAVNGRALDDETGTAPATPASRAGDPIASVIIPAHDEEAVIGRLLASLRIDLDPGQLDVVVACNGCTDGTETIARRQGARVVVVPEPSKIGALNAGDAAATTFPRIYVDADVVLTGRAVADMAHALTQPGVLAAAPPIATDTVGRRWAVRAFYDVWEHLPYFDDNPIGSGVYGLSEAGRARFDRFPDVIADDLFARNLFVRDERRVVATDPFVVQAPWSLRALVRRRIRIHAGNMQIAAHPELNQLPGGRERSAPSWRAVVDHPRLAPKAVPYGAVNAVAKIAARRLVRSSRPVAWSRDDTTRTTPSSATVSLEGAR
jgi:glycosyltransferase involved in cell wall biosynthesis